MLCSQNAGHGTRKLATTAHHPNHQTFSKNQFRKPTSKWRKHQLQLISACMQGMNRSEGGRANTFCNSTALSCLVRSAICSSALRSLFCM